MYATKVESKSKESQFIAAIARCIKTSINGNIKLGMQLLDSYATNPNTDKMKLVVIVRECLTSFLQTGAVNYNNDNILHILVKASNTLIAAQGKMELIDISEDKKEINKLITLLCTQYKNFPLITHVNSQFNRPIALVIQENKIETDREITTTYAILKKAENINAFSFGSSIRVRLADNDDIPTIQNITQKLLERKWLSEEFPSIKKAILNVVPDQKKLLTIIHEHLYLFLSADAKTSDGYDILGLLTLFTGENELYAAKLMRTILTCFEPISHWLEIDDYFTTLYNKSLVEKSVNVKSILEAWNTWKNKNDNTAFSKFDSKAIASIPLMSNLYNDEKLTAQQNPLLSALANLLKSQENNAAITVLREYLAHKEYINKAEKLTSCLERPNVKQSWCDFLAAPGVRDENGKNLLSAFAYGTYKSEDEARKMLLFLEKILQNMKPGIKNNMLSTAIDTAIEQAKPYSPHLIALYLKHGAVINKQSTIYNNLLNKPWPELRKNPDDFCSKNDLVQVINGNFKLEAFLSPSIVKIFAIS
ncbi:MAG: hypothetical protein ACK4PR_08340 [Gammaproteobacteria bacterium]